MTDTRSGELYLDAQMSAPTLMQVPCGEVAVFGRGSPDKDGHNEDSMAVVPYGEFMTVLVVADGLGGSRDGHAASALAVTALSKELADAQSSDGAPRSAILNALESANKDLLREAHGSATTVVVATIAKDFLRAYHVGDSGLLQVGQRGRIKQQTVAHSPVGFAQAAGMIDEEQALHHAERHLVSNTVGIEHMSIEVGPALKLARYDTVLLASDGLFDNLRVDEIVERIRIGPIADAADKLLATATQRMATNSATQPSKPDDLSFILFRRTA